MNKEDDFIIYGRLVFILYLIVMFLITILNFVGIIKITWFLAFSPIWVLVVLAAVEFIICKLINKWRKK